MRRAVSRCYEFKALEGRVLMSGVPSSPTHPVATVASDTAVDLTWDRVGAGDTAISIWRSAAGGAYAKLVTLAGGSNVYVDTSCYPSTTYHYELTADNASGSSPLSDPAAATTPAAGGGLSARPAVTATVAAASGTTVELSWDGAGTGGNTWFLERSTDGGAYAIIVLLNDSATPGDAVTYADAPLAPATTYSYRTRLVSGADYGNYTDAVSVTTPARPAGLPAEPTGLTPIVNGATGTTLTWTDTNGGSASYRIETAPFSWATPKWTQVAQTAAGVTSYDLTTTAETFYYVRVRADNATGASGYTAPVVFRTASPGTGSPETYTIGPGKQYASLAALDWSQLGPGDTVQIYPNEDAGGNIIPYREKPLISVRGTAAAPITIVGIPDAATGQLPIIDGTDATTSAQWSVHYQPLEDTSLILIGSTAAQQAQSGGWSPGYLTVSGLEIRNAYAGDYTGSDGAAYAYNNPYGIYIEKGDHVTIRGCAIHDNAGGVFGAGQGDSRNLEQVTLDANSIYGNGVVNDYLEHNTYLEGIDTVYQYNTYGPLRTGSPGAAIKDRGAGTIIRYNSIEGGGHLIDVVEAQNYSGSTLTLGSFGRTYVYGNLLYNNDNQPNGAAATPIYYGNDTLPSPHDRNGVLYFYNNTLVDAVDQGGNLFRLNIFDLAEASDAVDARNNVIYNVPATAGGNVPEIGLLTTWGVGYLGTNWITQGWNVARPDQSFTGYLAGAANVIGNAPNDPGFVSAAIRDFQLAAGSQCLGQAGVLPADAPPVLYEYVGPRAAGQSVAGVTNLGAFQRGATATAPAAPANLAAAPADPLSIRLSWADNSDNETGFLIERGTDEVNFTEVASVNANTTTYTDAGRSSGVTYYYRVRATNAVGNSAYSNGAPAVGPAAPIAPAAPSNLCAAAAGFGQIKLSWADNSDNETGFLIERSPDGLTFTQVASVAADVTGYGDTGLASGTAYTYRIRATNSAGNSAHAAPAGATTAALGGGPFSLWTGATTPVTVEDSDPTSTEVGVKFRSDVAGYVSGVRFYKGPANTGTHVGHLWSRSGQLLASVTFAAETASGWQQARFASPVAIAANTTYVISYLAPNGRYAEDKGYFDAAGVDSGPLHAPASGVDGVNGVYANSSGSTFPADTFANANYWVDVVFSPDAPDATPPTVTGGQFLFQFGPRNISVAFSEDVSASLAVEDLKVHNLNTYAALPMTGVALAWDAATNTATWTFADLPDADYTASLAPADVADAAGNPLAGGYVLDFWFLNGDANRDRVVGFADLVVVAQNYDQPGQTWSTGDFDGDGNVGFADLVTVAQNYDKSLSGAAGPVAGPSFQEAMAAAFAPAAAKPAAPVASRPAPRRPAVVSKPKPAATRRPTPPPARKPNAVVAPVRSPTVKAAVATPVPASRVFGTRPIRRPNAVADLLASGRAMARPDDFMAQSDFIRELHFCDGPAQRRQFTSGALGPYWMKRYPKLFSTTTTAGFTTRRRSTGTTSWSGWRRC